MNHFNPVAVATTVLLCTATPSDLRAQHPTGVAPSNKCEIIEDFTNNNGGFRSPSIYTESSYTEFHWNSTRGRWQETSGLASRSGSLISPVYENQQPSGGVDIGFFYEAPSGSEYRIRIIDGSFDIIASTANGPSWTPFPSTSGRVCVRLNDPDLIQGQKMRVEISFRSNQAGHWAFDELGNGGEQAALVLPVTFLGFSAKKEAGKVALRWDVADEVDVRGYEVERSTNGINFNVIGFIPANRKPVYSFTDAQRSEGTVYYRVKNLDLDGRFKYSSVIRIGATATASSAVLKAFPQPARSSVTLQHDKLGAAGAITVSTMDGRILRRVSPPGTAVQTTLDLSALLPGMYLVQTFDTQGNQQSTTLVKQ